MLYIKYSGAMQYYAFYSIYPTSLNITLFPSSRKAFTLGCYWQETTFYKLA